MGMITFPIDGKTEFNKIHVPVTTNQLNIHLNAFSFSMSTWKICVDNAWTVGFLEGKQPVSQAWQFFTFIMGYQKAMFDDCNVIDVYHSPAFETIYALTIAIPHGEESINLLEREG